MLSEALSRDVYRTKRQLAELMRCTPRDVEHAVEQARKRSQLPVLSGPDGYRLARNPEELAYNVERRHKRAMVQLVTIQGEKAYLERWRAHLNPPDEPAAVQEAIQW